MVGMSLGAMPNPDNIKMIRELSLKEKTLPRRRQTLGGNES